MKKLLIALALLLIPSAASAQCTGRFPANTLCGNLTNTAAPPHAFAAGGSHTIGPPTTVIGDVATWANVGGTMLADTTPTALIDSICSTNNDFLIRLSGTWQCFAPPFSVAQGGTGLATLTAHGVMLGEGTSSPGFATVGTGGRLLIDQGGSADPAFVAMSGSCTINSSGVTSCAAGAASSITIGTTTIISGTNLRILYDNSGVIGELSPNGTGNPVMTTSPSITTPTLTTPTISNPTISGTVTDNATNAFNGTSTFNATATFASPVVFQQSIKVPVRTAVSTTDNVSATTDYFICADNGGGSATENLPAGATGLTFLIKDCSGNAATHTITISPISPTTLDGVSQIVLNTNYQSLAVTYTGSQWSGN